MFGFVSPQSLTSSMWVCPDLYKGDLAGADITLFVSYDHLTIVLQPTLLAQHTVDAGHYLVPFIVITITTHTKMQYFTHLMGIL